MAVIEELEETSEAIDIKDLESLIGYVLPNSYREFLIKHNGARTKPFNFESIWYDDDGYEKLIVASLDYLFSGIEAVKTFEVVRDRIPVGMFPIGQDPGGNLLLLSVGGQTLGSIYFWMNDYCPYGEGDNVRLGEVALDFDLFVDGLFDEADY